MTKSLILFALLLSGCKSKSLGRPVEGKSAAVESAVASSVPHREPFKVSDIVEALKPCPEEANLAALNKLHPVLGHLDVTSASSLDAEEYAIKCYRPWAASITDTCQRNAIADWLDYYQEKVRAGREKLAEGKAESNEAAYWRKYNEEQDRAKAWESKHPFPKLPQCESKPETRQ